MNLKEWIGLDADTRAHLAEEWCHNLREPERLGNLVKEAAAALMERLTHLPQVTAVTGTLSNGSEIIVTTSLSTGATLSEVPEEFATFRVVQIGVAGKKANYLKRLRFVLRAAQVSETAESTSFDFLEEHLRDVVSPYYCASEEKWIAEIVIGAKFEDKLFGKPLGMLRSEIRTVLTDFFRNHDSTQMSLDSAALSNLRTHLASAFDATRKKLASEWCHAMRGRCNA